MGRVDMDQLDYQIVHALGANGRASFRDIATALDSTEQTVGRRYRRLIETGVVRIVALGAPDPADMGQFLRLHVAPGSAMRLAEALARRDDVSWVRLAGAGTEVVCGVRAESSSQRDHLILEQLPNTGRIRQVTAHEILHHFRRPGYADWEGFPYPLTDEQREHLALPALPDPPTGVTDQDRQILHALADNGRRSAAEIATLTRQPESTIRRQLATLLESGAIYLDIDIDPCAFGHAVAATLYIDVDPAHLHAAGCEMTRHGSTTFVAAVTGPANLVAAVTCDNVRDLYTYVTATLTGIHGMLHIETSITSQYLKHARTARNQRQPPLREPRKSRRPPLDTASRT